jgi:ADP-heptose:LPS heptosyltransferase
MKPQRILIIQLKRIGDCILTAPAVAALHTLYPQAEIVAIVPQGTADLVRCFVGLDRVFGWRDWVPNWDIWPTLLHGEWDLVYDFTGTDRSALMTALTRAANRRGYAKFARSLRARAYTQLCPASVRDLHTVDFHLALVGDDLTIPARCLTVPIVEGDAAILSGSAVVHIGTAREEKFWPAERWAEVITDLAKHHTVILTGTNSGLERPHLDRLRMLLNCDYRDLTGQLSLVQLAGCIQQCRIAVGVDSMAMHLAAVFQRPQVVLFGPTNPYHWRPRHAQAQVIVAGRPGVARGFTPKAKGNSMDLISTLDTLDAIELALAIE